jgi:hypothetical protein
MTTTIDTTFTFRPSFYIGNHPNGKDHMNDEGLAEWLIAHGATGVLTPQREAELEEIAQGEDRAAEKAADRLERFWMAMQELYLVDNGATLTAFGVTLKATVRRRRNGMPQMTREMTITLTVVQ